jgi:enoyl-CoA hydratase/carnithine racemase
MACVITRSAAVPFNTILYDIQEHILTITFNRPEKLNAFSRELVHEAIEAFQLAEADDEVHLVIITGAGRAFSAGYDISGGRDEQDRSPYYWRLHQRENLSFSLQPWQLSKPVIAMVNGYCLAGACELALMCDLRVASDQATFGEPEIRFGAGAPILITPWIVGLTKAKELLYTGDTMDAHEALRLNMINKVVPHESLREETHKLARRILKIAPENIRLTKQAINKTFEMMGLKHALEYNVEVVTIMENTETEVQRTFNQIKQERGLRAALDWRDARFRE